jgi:hypothetical protein
MCHSICLTCTLLSTSCPFHRLEIRLRLMSTSTRVPPYYVSHSRHPTVSATTSVHVAVHILSIPSTSN